MSDSVIRRDKFMSTGQVQCGCRRIFALNLFKLMINWWCQFNKWDHSEPSCEYMTDGFVWWHFAMRFRSASFPLIGERVKGTWRCSRPRERVRTRTGSKSGPYNKKKWRNTTDIIRHQSCMRNCAAFNVVQKCIKSAFLGTNVSSNSMLYYRKVCLYSCWI